jgi:succinoglycan biosynthesis protein ExoM
VIDSLTESLTVTKVLCRGELKKIMMANLVDRDHISVCIPTFRRNGMLERLLQSLAIQETDGLFTYSVVVVDNDSMGAARDTVMRMKMELGLDLFYGIEPERTIPAVRNCALMIAKGNYIGIIDDDEFAPSDWLITLFRAIQSFGVDGALGPVRPFFESEPPRWLLKSRLCERTEHQTGTLLHWSQTRTGNVLLKKEVFQKNNIRFNENYRTGGSDREFFKQAMRAGCRFVAVKEAPVFEVVPPERWGKGYYLKRALVNGFNAHKISVGNANRLPQPIMAIKLALKSVICALAIPTCACLGVHLIMNCLEKGCHSLSRLLAIFGIEAVKKRDF